MFAERQENDSKTEISIREGERGEETRPGGVIRETQGEKGKRKHLERKEGGGKVNATRGTKMMLNEKKSAGDSHCRLK